MRMCDGCKPPSPRYKGAPGKSALIMRPQRTQWWLDYVEHEELAVDPGSVLGKELRHRFHVPFSMYRGFLAEMRLDSRFSNDMAAR